MKRDQPEFRFHCVVVDYLAVALRKDIWFTHFPAGERRDAMAGARLKRMATKPGVADLLFILPGGKAHWLELKAGSGGQSEAQKEFQARMAVAGCRYAVARNLDDVQAILDDWGALRTRGRAAEQLGLLERPG